MDIMPCANYQDPKFQIPSLSIKNVTVVQIREMEG
jgi:hypothetical protein